jgi:hypothetical protein
MTMRSALATVAVAAVLAGAGTAGAAGADAPPIEAGPPAETAQIAEREGGLGRGEEAPAGFDVAPAEAKVAEAAGVAIVGGAPVPLPAAIWFLLATVGALIGLRWLRRPGA